MMYNTEEIQPYERQTLLIALSVLMNSPYLDENQKKTIEMKFQEIIDVYVRK